MLVAGGDDLLRVMDVEDSSCSRLVFCVMEPSRFLGCCGSDGGGGVGCVAVDGSDTRRACLLGKFLTICNSSRSSTQRQMCFTDCSDSTTGADRQQVLS